MVAGVELRKHHIALAGLVGDDEATLALLEAGLHGVGQPTADIGLEDQPVDHQLNVVLALLVEVDLLLELPQPAVDASPGEAPLLGIQNEILVLAFAVLDQGSQQDDLGALFAAEDLLDDLLGGLLAHHPAPKPQNPKLN